MRVIDLTQTITENMPVYPGTEGPKLQPASTCEKDGFRETLLTMYSHTGTHMDAPAHIFAGRPTLDTMDAGCFVGKGLILDCREFREGQEIPLDKIRAADVLAEEADFLLFLTGWSRRWGSEAYFGAYPVLSREACQFLIDTGKKGVGLDVISLDPIADAELTRHHQVLAHGMVIVENLTNLEEAYEASRGGLFTLAVLPMKYENADGAPVRAVAIMEE